MLRIRNKKMTISSLLEKLQSFATSWSLDMNSIWSLYWLEYLEPGWYHD